MTPFLEFEGKNVDKAVVRACEQLNILRENLNYDVISYGSTGIFGLVGAKKARIRVSLPQTATKKAASSEREQRKKAVSIKTKKDTPEKTEAIKENEHVAGAADSRPVDLGHDILNRIVELITDGAVVTVNQSSDSVVFNVKGGNSAILIGKRGQTLESIQYVLEKIINKNTKDKLRVQIDVEGYLEAKRERLQKLAERLSLKVKLSGKPVTIGQMNSHDRRLVHLALKDDTDVRTQSVGDGIYRKLMIFPGKSFQRKRRNGGSGNVSVNGDREVEK